LGADGLAAQGSGMDRSGDEGGPDARAAGVKLGLSSSSELEIDLGMHGGVAPVVRFRDRLARKRYTFYYGVSSIAKKSRFLIRHGVADQSRLPMSTHCLHEMYLQNHKILMSHLRKDFAPSPAEIKPDSSARPDAKTRHLSTHRAPRVRQWPQGTVPIDVPILVPRPKAGDLGPGRLPYGS
jgi:hypothetical protein